MESAAAGTTTSVPEERRLPEARINHTIELRWAFIDKAISGMGKLALAWATVVLLGGFSTLIKQKDFLFITIITFLEATRLGIRFMDPYIYPYVCMRYLLSKLAIPQRENKSCQMNPCLESTQSEQAYLWLF
ncbi:hypothetical protein PVAP13_7NG105400 [Panicum virgatum]|uniref:Uncharacterized protein n=1 Tax=Panicum virgatum TaxID=38727 RepID=A0A8T0PUZ8_PANVG|nr:hypothetical protein PVAP13_7NG105400 [Panicum virgatum]